MCAPPRAMPPHFPHKQLIKVCRTHRAELATERNMPHATAAWTVGNSSEIDI